MHLHCCEFCDFFPTFIMLKSPWHICVSSEWYCHSLSWNAGFSQPCELKTCDPLPGWDVLWKKTLPALVLQSRSLSFALWMANEHANVSVYSRLVKLALRFLIGLPFWLQHIAAILLMHAAIIPTKQMLVMWAVKQLFRWPCYSAYICCFSLFKSGVVRISECPAAAFKTSFLVCFLSFSSDCSSKNLPNHTTADWMKVFQGLKRFIVASTVWPCRFFLLHDRSVHLAVQTTPTVLCTQQVLCQSSPLFSSSPQVNTRHGPLKRAC